MGQQLNIERAARRIGMNPLLLHEVVDAGVIPARRLTPLGAEGPQFFVIDSDDIDAFGGGGDGSAGVREPRAPFPGAGTDRTSRSLPVGDERHSPA